MSRYPKVIGSLSTRARGFDIAYEILATIPLASPCSIRQLAKDFGVSTSTALNAIGRLRNRFAVGIEKGMVAILPGGKTAVDRAAESYWEKIYGVDLN